MATTHFTAYSRDKIVAGLKSQSFRLTYGQTGSTKETAVAWLASNNQQLETTNKVANGNAFYAPIAAGQSLYRGELEIYGASSFELMFIFTLEGQGVMANDYIQHISGFRIGFKIT